MTTSHYTEYGTLPTLTEQEKEDMLSAKELPSVTSHDNGKALIVDGGKWKKKNIPSQLPEVSSTDNGDVLTVVEGQWAKGDIPSQLPAVSGTDNGKVLTVVEGAWAKAAASGGNVTFVVSEEEGALNKTWQEIFDAASSGKICYISTQGETTVIMNYIVLAQYMAVGTFEGKYIVRTMIGGAEYPYVADTASDYPVALD